MPDYRLSKAADEDLIQISLYGYENFGREQSENYRDKLKKQFSAIASSPLHFASVDHIHEGYRRSVCGSHSIYYAMKTQGVLIARILGQQEPHKAVRKNFWGRS